MLALFSGCYVNLKSKIDREVKVEISGNVPVIVSNTGNSTFSSYMTQEQYVEKFLEGVRGELSGTENVVIVETGGEFRITFDQLQVTETTKTEKVDDTESDDHGKEFELTTLNFSASGKVVRVSDGSSESWTAYKDKSEDLTSSRSAGQVLTGDNKDKTEYREKTFDSGTAEDLTRKTGRRSGVVIVRDIGKLIK
ncbi:MAG: hypothetical protein Crog4KO_20910 [Crocinitomicaceae bacterium]